MKVQAALHDLGLECQVVELPGSTRTALEAAQAVGCGVGQIVKSLMFRGKSSGRPLLALVSGSNRVDEKKLAALAGEATEKADADFTRQHTGFAIGGVPPLGHTAPLTTFIDEDLLQYAEVWAAAGTPHAVFRIAPADLVRASAGRTAAVK
jgi:prolyl-tRNA editing enzyme YbaK/EbsC (Cys-tRNA(Pro) deacylase)